MKVLVISAAFPPMLTGEAEHTLFLCEHLAEQGHEVHVLTSRNAMTNCGQLRVYPIIQNWTWVSFLRIVRLLRQLQPDAILLLYSGWIFLGHPMMSLLPSISKALLPRVSFVTQFEVEIVMRGGSLIERVTLMMLERILGQDTIDSQHGTLLSRSDGIIVLSERHQVKLSEKYSKVNNKIVVIPPPPLIRMCSNMDRVKGKRKEVAINGDEFVLVYFGYIYVHKGIETLLNAFQKIIRQKSNVRLVMVGGIPDNLKSSSYGDDLRKLADNLGISDRVKWTGQYEWDSDEPSLWLSAADACVLPFDLGVLLTNSSFAAAAAHGLPIITTKGPYLESQFNHQGNVLLCPPKDPDALATAILSLMENLELREILKSAVQVLAKEWFSWPKAIERTIMAFSLAPSTSYPSSSEDSKPNKGLGPS
jgi:glycosyltransferase involved in cell wall biosynthesis